MRNAPWLCAAVVAVAAVSCGGCATIVGSVVGPVAAPVSMFEHTHGLPTWAKVLMTPAAVGIGPFLGLCTGVACDAGYARNLAYGVDGDLPFAAVFDPTNPDWGRSPDTVARGRWSAGAASRRSASEDAAETARTAAPRTAPPTGRDPADYVLVFLKAGPAEPTLTPETIPEIRAGHFANMERLAAQGALLVAGPMVEPRVDPALRGVFVFDTDDVAEARELTSTDPAVESGVFAFEAYPWRSSSPMRRILEIERAAAATQPDPGADAAPGGGESVRAYVLVTAAAPPDAVERALEPVVAAGQVLFAGQLGGGLEGTTLLVLDAETVDAARTILEPLRGPDGAAIDWVLHPWFSTAALVDAAR